MSRDTIKYIAAFTMLINHIGIIFMKPPMSEIMIDIGFFTAITMCAFLVEGYRYSRSVKKYGMRLLACACLSQIPYSLAFPDSRITLFHIEFYQLNMVFNLFFCFLIIHVYYSCYEPLKRAYLMALLFLAGYFCDWSIMAPGFVLFFLWAGDSRPERYKAWFFSICLVGAAHWFDYIDSYPLLPALWHTLGTMAGPAAAACCLLFLYNGRKSDRMVRFHKWFFYIFYPLHLLILSLC